MVVLGVRGMEYVPSQFLKSSSSCPTLVGIPRFYEHQAPPSALVAAVALHASILPKLIFIHLLGLWHWWGDGRREGLASGSGLSNPLEAAVTSAQTSTLRLGTVNVGDFLRDHV